MKLPSHSRYMAALAQDEDIASQWLDVYGDGDVGPQLAGYDLHAAKLDTLIDAVTALAVGLGGGKFEPVRRPQTAFDQARSRRAMDLHYSLVAQLVPKPG